MKTVKSVTLNEDGTIKGILFEGNKRATPLSVVIRMLDDGRDIDFADSNLEVVKRSSGTYVRSKANENTEDNLGAIAEEVKEEEKAMEEVAEKIMEAEEEKPGFWAKLKKSILG